MSVVYIYLRSGLLTDVEIEVAPSVADVDFENELAGKIAYSHVCSV